MPTDPADARTTSSDIEVQPVYTSEDLPGELADRVGEPGQFPYTRGVYPEMYRQRLWTMRQYAGFSTAEASNERYKLLLASGARGLSVAFDLPTQIGYDADDPMAEGEVGKVGVSICSIEDMRRLFDGIELAKVSTSMTINSTAPILLALYVAVAKEQGADLSRLGGTIQNDILKEYAARGTYIYPPRPSMRFITDVFGWCAAELPRWNTISISGYHIREAGATAVEELAFTLADGIAYVQAALDAGLNVDVFGQRLSFFFNAHNTFLEEVAKFRAARKLWAEIMRDRFGATSPKAQMLRFHTQTGGSTLAAQQPYNNVARVTLQALAAVMGGTQSLHTNGYDEALALPSEQAATLALRTQQIIGFESGVADTVDPFAGSFVVERLTAEVEAEARRLIEQVDEMGGAVAAIEEGFFQDRIASSAYRAQLAVESGEQVVVGVNRFQTDGEDAPVEMLKVPDAIRDEQAARLRVLRDRRDELAWSSAMDAIESAARGDENLMPLVLRAVEAEATVGEIAHRLRDVWGEYAG
ncbi:MAG: methylmalonyl-CoA mutase family protein [Rubricoccaceae bacterium]